MSSQSSQSSQTSSVSRSEDETRALGARLGRLAFPGLCVLFRGELGAGKTVFIRGVCEALGVDKRTVRSPSFTLVNEYSGTYPVAHADLYRLENRDAARSLSLPEYADEGRILLVEWAEYGDFSDMDNVISINIETTGDEDTRSLAFSARGPQAEALLAEFAVGERTP